MAAGRLPSAPQRFTPRAQGVLTDFEQRTDQIQATVDAATDLLADVRGACQPASR